MTKDEALKIALEALEKLAKLGNGDTYGNSIGNVIAQAAITAAKEAFAQPAQERRFCPRCGTRLMGALDPVSIHTCCPPNGRTFDDYGNKIA